MGRLVHGDNAVPERRRYALVVDRATNLRVTVAVLWSEMVRAPGFVFWPITAALTVLCVVLLVLGGSRTAVLFGLLSLSGVYCVVFLPLQLFVHSYRKKVRGNPPGEYRSEFADDRFAFKGPKGVRRVADSEVTSIEEHRSYVFVRIVGEDEDQQFVVPSPLFPPVEVSRIQAKLRR